eukprot:336938-Amphidinium_carterae.1
MSTRGSPPIAPFVQHDHSNRIRKAATTQRAMLLGQYIAARIGPTETMPQQSAQQLLAPHTLAHSSRRNGFPITCRNASND